MSMTRPERTLFLLVTCSRDPTRRDMAVTVTRNVADCLSTLGLNDRLVTFDNASLYQDHLNMLPKGARICRSAENLGYWSAIKWALDNLSGLADFSCDFLYIIESDLVHSNFSALGKCELFLDAEQAASSGA